MTHRVGDGFGGDAEQVMLGVGGEAKWCGIELERQADVFAGFGQLAGGLGDGSGETGFLSASAAVAAANAAQARDRAARLAHAGPRVADDLLERVALLR